MNAWKTLIKWLDLAPAEPPLEIKNEAEAADSLYPEKPKLIDVSTINPPKETHHGS